MSRAILLMLESMVSQDQERHLVRRAVDKRMDEWRGEGDLAPYQGAALADVATPRAALLPTMSGACVAHPRCQSVARSRH